MINCGTSDYDEEKDKEIMNYQILIILEVLKDKAKMK